MKKSENDDFLEIDDEKEEPIEKKESVKKPTLITTKKTKHIVSGISGAYIYTYYFVDGKSFGARLEMEEKYKSLKLGDEILL